MFRQEVVASVARRRASAVCRPVLVVRRQVPLDRRGSADQEISDRRLS
jgi:hypothetical protein